MPLFDRPPVRDFPDRAIRQALEDPPNLRDTVMEALPELAAQLDFSQVEYPKPAFLLEDWRRRESDLLALVPFREAAKQSAEAVLICLLVEHQSQPDPLMPLRALLFALLFWEQQWKEYEKKHELGASLQLTPVVPLIFHTGQQPWNSNRSLGELFAGPESLRVWAPSWPTVFWDLAARSPEQLLGSAGPFTQFLAVVRAEKEETEKFRQVFVDLVRNLEPLARQDTMRWRDLLWLMVSWVLQRRPDEEREPLFQAAAASQHDLALAQEVSKMSQTTGKTWVEKLYQEWLQTEGKRLQHDIKQQVTKELQQQFDKELQQRVDREVQQHLDRELQQRLDRELQQHLDRELQQYQTMLIEMLTEVFGPLPDERVAQINACTDTSKLLGAIRRIRTLDSLDNLQL